MKTLKLIAILSAGAVIAFLVGAIGFALSLPPDPTGYGSPGDGFGFILFGGLGAIVGLIISALLETKISGKNAARMPSSQR